MYLLNKERIIEFVAENLLSFSISNTFSTPRRLFCNNHKNKYFISILSRQQNRDDRFLLTKNEVNRSVTSFLYYIAEKAVPFYTL